MENQTRFDINAAIENWREELAAQPNLASDDQRELETHLRDAIAGFQQRGLNDEEAFWLARRRIGQPQQLGEEFVKADLARIWRERLFWMWLAVFLSSTLGSIAGSAAFALQPVNGSSASMMMQIIIITLRVLVPIILAVLLARGKMTALFSKLTLLIENRFRFATAAFMCIALSSSIWGMALAGFNTNIGGHLYSSSIMRGLTSAFYPLVVLLVLIWLKPPQKRTTPKKGS